MLRTQRRVGRAIMARRISLVRSNTPGHPLQRSPFLLDLSLLEWHTLSINEVCTRLGVSQKLGLDSSMAARRLSKNGKNVISPPPSNLLRKIFFYIFGGMVKFIQVRTFYLASSQVSGLFFLLLVLFASSRGNCFDTICLITVSQCHYRKPLGNPDPQVSDLALGVVLLIVIAIQAIFNAWQGGLVISVGTTLILM